MTEESGGPPKILTAYKFGSFRNLADVDVLRVRFGGLPPELLLAFGSFGSQARLKPFWAVLAVLAVLGPAPKRRATSWDF